MGSEGRETELGPVALLRREVEIVIVCDLVATAVWLILAFPLGAAEIVAFAACCTFVGWRWVQQPEGRVDRESSLDPALVQVEPKSATVIRTVWMTVLVAAGPAAVYLAFQLLNVVPQVIAAAAAGVFVGFAAGAAKTAIRLRRIERNDGLCVLRTVRHRWTRRDSDYLLSRLARQEPSGGLS